MAQQDGSRLQKLRSDIFQKTDIIELDVKFEKVLDKEFGTDKDRILNDAGLFVYFETLLKAGPLWKFNPTCLSLFIRDNQFKYNETLLIESIKERGIFTCVEIDKNLNLHNISYTMRLLKLNTHFLQDDVILNAEYVCVETIMGKITQ